MFRAEYGQTKPTSGAGAPVIMMSQNRREARDRKRAGNDYKVNLKAELEIRSLHEKFDHLPDRQWQYLIGIRQIQVELPQELAARSGKSPTRGAG